MIKTVNDCYSLMNGRIRSKHTGFMKARVSIDRSGFHENRVILESSMNIAGKVIRQGIVTVLRYHSRHGLGEGLSLL